MLRLKNSKKYVRNVSILSSLAATLCVGVSHSAMAACTEAGGAVTCTGAGATPGVTASAAAQTVTIDAGTTVQVIPFREVSGATANNVDTATGVASVGADRYGGVILPQIYHFDGAVGGGTPVFTPPVIEGEDAHGDDVDVVDNAGVSVVNNGVITSANVNPAGPASAATRNTYGVFLTGSNNTVTNNGTISIGNAFSTSTMYGVYSSVPTGENYYDNNTVINNGVIEVTRSGAGTARAIYFGEQQLGMNVQNNAGGVIRATRVGAVAVTNTNVTAVIDTDDTPGALTVNNAGTLEVTGVKTSVIYGRSSQTEINNDGIIRNNSWSAVDTIASAHYAIGSYAGALYASDPNSPDPDSPLPLIVGGEGSIVDPSLLRLTNSATGQIIGDVLAVDANPFTAYVLGGGFMQTGTSGNLAPTNISTRDSIIDNAGAITGNIYIGSGAHQLFNTGTITGAIAVNQTALTACASSNTGACANGPYTIHGDRTFDLVNSGVLTGGITITDFADSVNTVDLFGTGFQGNLIAVNGTGDNTASFENDMSVASVQRFRTLNLNDATVTVTGAGGVSLQDGATITTTITAPGGSLLAPSTDLGNLAFSAGTLTLAGATTITPTTAAVVHSGEVFQVASSTTGGTVDATDTALVDWTASQTGGRLLLTADVQNARAIAGISRPGAAAVNGLLTVDGGDPDSSALAGAVQNLDAVGVRRAAAQLAPETNFATQQAALRLAAITGQTIDGRLTGAGASKPSGLVSKPEPETTLGEGSSVWAQAFGSGVRQDRISGVDGFSAKIYGLLAGVDNWVTPDARVGAAFGYARTTIDGRGATSGNDTDVDSYLALLYGGYYGPGWYVTGRTGYIFHDYDTTRELDGPIADSAKGDHHGHQFTASAEVGVPYVIGSATLTPVASLAYNRLIQNGYGENGGGMALDVRKQTTDSLASGLGVKASVAVADGTFLEGRAIWYHEFADNRQKVTARFAGGDGFTAIGPNIGRDTAGLGVGLLAVTAPGVTFQINYDATVGKNYIGHAGSAKVSVAF